MASYANTGNDTSTRVMKSSTAYVLAYILSPEDGDELCQILGSQFTGAEKILGAQDKLLSKVNAKVFSSSQILLLAAYVHLYAALRSRNLKDDPRLVALRKAAGIAPEFAAHVGRHMRSLSRTELDSYGSPLKTVLGPSQKVADWATDVVYTAVTMGAYVEKQRLPGLTGQEYEHPLDRSYLEALRHTLGLEMVVRRFFDWGLEPLLKVQYTGSNIKVTDRNFPQAHNALLRPARLPKV